MPATAAVRVAAIVYLGSGAGFVKKFQDALKSMLDRLPAYRLAVAAEVPRFRNRSAVFHGPGESPRAPRFFLAAATRAGDAGDRERHRARAALERANGHLAGRFLADGTVPLERSGAHAEQLLLGLVRIGDEATLEPRRGSGEGGELLRRPAAGAGFGRDQYGAARLEPCTDFFGER